MVNVALAAVLERDPEPAALRDDRADRASKGEVEPGDPRAEPVAAGRPDATVSHRLLQHLGKTTEERRDGDDPVEAWWADVRRREQQAVDGRPVEMPSGRCELSRHLRGRQPVNAAGTNGDGDVGAGLAQQRRRLERTLAAADDEHATICEPGEVEVFRRMRCELRRDRVELARTCRKRSEPCRDDDTAGVELVAFLEPDAEAVPVRLDARDRAFVHIGHGLPAIPVGVPEEVGDRDRRLHVRRLRVAVLVEGQPSFRMRDARSLPGGA